MSLNGKPVLALIPARGGSKGVIGKNMRKVMDIPLVGYTLTSALKSKYISEVYLSSDDELTLSYGQEVGVTLIRRPIEHSTDTASANSVVKHFLSTINEKLIEQDPYILYLQPTSPLRTVEHIDAALEKMLEKRAHKLISVMEMTKSPFKAFVRDKQGNLKALFDESSTNMRRQDLPQVFIPNGAIYVFRLSDFNEKNVFPSNGSVPYIMSLQDSLDVDIETDLNVFEKKLNKTA